MASGYLLDTNVVSAATCGEPLVSNRISGIAVERLHLSALVLAELAAGTELGNRRAGTLAIVREVTAGMPVLTFDADDAMIYARIRAALQRKGASIGAMDMLIAAQAVARGLVLVTDNLREFRRVPGLKCENWMR